MAIGVLTGATVGFGSAAVYPSPFTSNTAVVVGTGEGVAPSDAVAAAAILSDLDAAAAGSVGSTVNEDGEVVKIEKTSDKFNLGDDASTVFVGSIDDDDLPDLLGDGTYLDEDNTEYDYTQKVELGANLDLEHFSDTDYDDLIGASDKTPSIGISLADGNHVLNYTLDFTTNPDFNAATMETTTLRLLGKDYYILDITNGSTNKTTFLDSANSLIISEGESKTSGGKTVSIDFISSTEVTLQVDGQTTNSMAEGATYKLPDGTYVGVKDIRFDSRDGGISQVEISLGTGKLEISDGTEVELNDDTIQEIVGYLQMSGLTLDKIVLQWNTDNEEFITPEAKLLMPAFEALELSMADHTIPEEETIEVEFSGNDLVELTVPLKDGSHTIPLLSANSTGEFTLIGKDSSNRLFTTNSTSAVRFNQTYGHKYFVASWNASGEAESYYIRAQLVTEDSIDKVKFTNQITNEDKTAANGTSVDFGSVTLTVNNITDEASDENFIMSINSGGSFHELYTAEGLKVYLPFESPSVLGAPTTKGLINFTDFANETTGHNFDSFYLFFDEENKDEDIGAGDSFNVTLGEASDKVTVSTVSTDSSGHEIGDTDDIEYYQVSDLATRVLHKTGGDQDSVMITYHGSQMTGNLYLSAPGATSGGSSGAMTVTDAEISTVSGKNLIVVGGSAINSVAAELLGGSYRTEEFTAMTGVAAGEFLVQSLDRGGRTALLVAGYNAQDTQKAVTWLTNTDDVTTDVGTKYKGTSATEASLVVA